MIGAKKGPLGLFDAADEVSHQLVDILGALRRKTHTSSGPMLTLAIIYTAANTRGR